jgi:hypothetical protein
MVPTLKLTLEAIGPVITINPTVKLVLSTNVANDLGRRLAVLLI